VVHGGEISSHGSRGVFLVVRIADDAAASCPVQEPSYGVIDNYKITGGEEFSVRITEHPLNRAVSAVMEYFGERETDCENAVVRLFAYQEILKHPAFRQVEELGSNVLRRNFPSPCGF
jgi:hypothetical protein